ncbi:MAG: signal peptidase I [Eubacteriales bacterium]
MNDIPGGIPDGTYSEEAEDDVSAELNDSAVTNISDAKQKSEAAEPSVSESDAAQEETTGLTEVPPLHEDTGIAQYPEEQPTSLVIRRVRTEPPEVLPPAPKDRGFLYSLLDTARFVSLGLVIGIVLVVFVVQRNDVFGPSMEPNLHENDAVFVEMISKYFTTPERGNIMTINATGLPGYTKKEKIIKRLIGLPGETVTIKDGKVYINGVLLNEPYLAANVPTNINDNGAASGYDNITLGPDQYYFMGDNRGASLDSRVLGPISFDRIKAHVIAKIYPFDDMGLL